MSLFSPLPPRLPSLPLFLITPSPVFHQLSTEEYRVFHSPLRKTLSFFFFVLKQPDLLLSVLTAGKEGLAVIFSAAVWATNTLTLPALLHIHFKSS